MCLCGYAVLVNPNYKVLPAHWRTENCFFVAAHLFLGFSVENGSEFDIITKDNPMNSSSYYVLLAINKG